MCTVYCEDKTEHKSLIKLFDNNKHLINITIAITITPTISLVFPESLGTFEIQDKSHVISK